MERIINSKLDTDLYKLTMGQAVKHRYSEVGAGYEFINRGKTQFPDTFDCKLQDQVERMAEIKTKPEEVGFLAQKCNGIFTSDYLDWFNNYCFDPDEVKITRENGRLSVNIEGPWERTIYWEVPLMAAISELYFKETEQNPVEGWQQRALWKAQTLKEAGAKFAEFGTRRRYSRRVHESVLQILKEHAQGSLVGTSNVELAMKEGLTPVGTFAHELVMAMAGIYGAEQANSMALLLWKKEFPGKLSTALTDTYTTDVFLRTFTGKLVDDFKTLRQDSGIPEKWTDKISTHLKSMGINPLTRTALYSDALNIPRILEILDYNKDKINSLFGVGTDLTNDVGVTPLNMVIKLHYIILNGQRIDVCKLSDNPIKISGDPRVVRETLERLHLPVAA